MAHGNHRDLAGSIGEICPEEIHAEAHSAPGIRLHSRILRFFTWWLPVSSVYLMAGGTCPFCGQAGCLAGSAGVGVVGALLSLYSRRR